MNASENQHTQPSWVITPEEKRNVAGGVEVIEAIGTVSWEQARDAARTFSMKEARNLCEQQLLFEDALVEKGRRVAHVSDRAKIPEFSFRRFGGRSRAARRVKFPPANRS